MATYRLPNNWQPRPDQMPLWTYLEQGGKRAVEVAHRRWGKDDVALHWTCYAAMQRPGNYWHMLPEYSQARKAIWDAVNPHTGKRRIDEAFPAWVRKATNNQEMKITLINGSVWQVVGSDSFDSLVGSPPVGLVFSEYALANPYAWGFLRPILAENGGWAIFISSTRGSNHLRTLYDMACKTPGWFADVRRADQTPVFKPEQLASERLELIAERGDIEGDALFQQEYMCSWDSIQPGAYWSKQIHEAMSDGRITKVSYNPAHPVMTAWDIGYDDFTTIWMFQHIGPNYMFLDYYQGRLLGVDHYAKILKDTGYNFGEHYMPHDANDGSAQTGNTYKQQAESVGIRPVIVVDRPQNNSAVIAQINGIRSILSQCWFDQDRCRDGLSALECYRSEWDEKMKRPGLHPVHDWASHGASAMRTLISGYKPRKAIKSQPIPPMPMVFI